METTNSFDSIEFKPIGIIHTPFKKPEGMPIQPAGGKGIKGTIKVFKEYQAGLKDLDGFSHIVLLYFFHRARDISSMLFPLWIQSCVDYSPPGLPSGPTRSGYPSSN